MRRTEKHLRIAVLIPCRDEAAAIARVVTDFRACLPDAEVHVFDNGSRDDSLALAKAAGAHVHRVALIGKGNVVRRAFADVEADVYVMVDGDDTYEAAAAPAMVARLLDEELDMLVGKRIGNEAAAYRRGHRFGNRMLTEALAMLFGRSFDDLLSGYRVFSRRYVKSFPAHACGFEIETELAVHALQLRMAVGEVPTVYRARGDGSVSKLRTYRDGWRILGTLVGLFKTERPLRFFGICGIACAALALALAVPLLVTWWSTGLVPRFPTAVLCAALSLLGALLAVCGLVLDTVTRGRVEAKRLAYLTLPGPGVLQSRGDKGDPLHG